MQERNTVHARVNETKDIAIASYDVEASCLLLDS